MQLVRIMVRPMRTGRSPLARRWLLLAGVAVALFALGANENRARAASGSEAALSVADSRGSDAARGGGSATQVAQNLAGCRDAVSAERPDAQALATCRGVATAPWETNHTRVDAYIALGRALGRLDRFADALDAAHAAKALNLRTADLFLFEAWVLLKLNRLPEANAAARRAVETDSREAAAYLGLAFVTANLGAFDEVQALAARGLRASRESREKEVLRAVTALGGGGNIDTAISVVRSFGDRVVEVRSEAMFLLSGLLRERGDRLDAVQLLRRSIDLGPDTTGKRLALADALYELDRAGEAIAQLRRALRLDPIPEVAAEIRKVLAKAQGGVASAVPLPKHLDEVGTVTALADARTIRINPGYQATCRYQRALESVSQRRRQTTTNVSLTTAREAAGVVMRVRTEMPRQATGGRSEVVLDHAITFGARGMPSEARLTQIVAPGLTERQKQRAARALGPRIMEVLRLRYAGGTYRQGESFARNTELLRRAYQRQFQAYDQGAKITEFEDRSRLVGVTRRGNDEFFVVDTRLRGGSFVAGAEIRLDARGYVLIHAASGLIAEHRERMVTKVVDRGLHIVESESEFSCDIRGGTDQIVQPAVPSDRAEPTRVAVIDAELLPIGQVYRAKSNVNVRQAPRVNSSRVTGLRRGDRVTAIARVKGYDWILVGRDGQQLGYVFYSLIEPDPAAVVARAPQVAPAPVPPRQRRQSSATNQHGIAVIVGNRSYNGDVPPVDFAHNDADAMRDFVVETLGYRDGNIIDLRDATKAQLEGVFGTAQSHKGQLFDWIRPNRSDVVVFYSGHGVPGFESNRGYLLPVDGDPNRAELVGYGLDVMIANLKRLSARSISVYLDTCFSGGSHGGTLMRAASGLTIAPKLPEQTASITVLTAAQADQIASWDNEAARGLFTRHLLAALRGAADGDGFGDGDGKVTVGEVKRYLDEEMTYQARRRFGRDQQASVVGDDSAVLATVP